VEVAVITALTLSRLSDSCCAGSADIVDVKVQVRDHRADPERAGDGRSEGRPPRLPQVRTRERLPVGRFDVL